MKLIGLIRKAWRKLLRKKDYGVEVVKTPDGGSYVRFTHSLVAKAELLPFGEDVEVKELHAPTTGTDKSYYRYCDGSWR